MANAQSSSLADTIELRSSFKVREPWLVTLFQMSGILQRKSGAAIGRPNDSIDSALRDYLDGYFLSADFYPVCTRSIFARNDAFALWGDFERIWADHLAASRELASDVEAISENRGGSRHGVGRRAGLKGEAAKIKSTVESR